MAVLTPATVIAVVAMTAAVAARREAQKALELSTRAAELTRRLAVRAMMSVPVVVELRYGRRGRPWGRGPKRRRT